MSAQAMLSLKVTLNIQPGEIPPTIHVKQGTDSMAAAMRIRAAEATLETAGTAVVKGTKTDGAEVFIVLPITDADEDYITVSLTNSEFAQMTDVAGSYPCTISIIDTEGTVTRANYEGYDLVTVQPFIMDVKESAAE